MKKVLIAAMALLGGIGVFAACIVLTCPNAVCEMENP